MVAQNSSTQDLSGVPAIKAVDIYHHYGVRPVLKHLNFEVKPGELVVLMGPNGMGKSTLLSILGGVMSPIKGRVEIFGVQRRKSVEGELTVRRKVAYLPDQCWLPAGRSGREFLVAVGKLYAIEDERLMDHIDRLLRLFDLEGQGDSPIASYSAGQKKKIALCAVLVTEASLLVLDEPFSGGLDPSALLALRQVLQGLDEKTGTTIFMSTPVPEIVENLAQRIIVLSRGEIAADDTVDGLRAKTGCSGSLLEVLETLFHPHTKNNISQYLQALKR